MTSLPILTISEYIRGENSHEFLSRELSLASRHFVKSVKITRSKIYFEDSWKILLPNLF